MFQVIATTTRKRNTTQNWDLRVKNDKIELSQTFFSLNDMQNNELTFGKSIDTYLLLISPKGQFYKKTARGENKSRTFSNPTLYQHLISQGTIFKLEVFQKDENGTYCKFTPLSTEAETQEEPQQDAATVADNQYELNF
jgi:hypothetical protein